MLNFSMIETFVNDKTLSFMAGTLIGFLGSYAVEWFKEYQTSSHPKGAFHIIDLTSKEPKVTNLTLPKFQNQITIQELNQLRKSVKWGIRTKKIWQTIFDASTNIVCVKKDKHLIGFGCFVGNGRMGTLFDIHVRPENQKQQIGSLIMNHLVNQIKSKEYVFVGLFGWEENKSVLKSYEKFGFKPNTYGMQSSSQELKIR